MRSVLLIIVPIVFSFMQGCREEKDTGQDPFGQDASLPFGSGEVISSLSTAKLHEASGMAASKKHKGRFWVHNDSGNDPELFLLNRDGTVEAIFHLANNANNRDWEDIALGPGPSGEEDMLYVADIGDNYGVRQSIQLYRFPEPAHTGEDASIEQFEVLNLRYPDRPRDAECLFIDPLDRQIIIISKRDDNSIVYTTPLSSTEDSLIVLDSIGVLPFNYVTAGDITQDGKEILLKTYRKVYYWERHQGTTIHVTLSSDPLELLYELEPQGEAIAWDADGSGFYTLSEKKGMAKQYIFFYPRR